MLVALDDDTLAAVIDDARVRSLDGPTEFLLVTPRSPSWGDERNLGDGYLATLDERVSTLLAEGVQIEHEWLPGEDLAAEVSETGDAHAVEGVVVAHHNPNHAIPDPEAFDDAIREALAVPLDVISLE